MQRKQPRAKPSRRDRAGRLSVSSTEAQNEFGRILDAASRGDDVVITKHNAPRAVLISVDRYEALARADENGLDRLTEQFDALLERMQTPEAIAGMKRAFESSPKELGRTAVSVARRRRAR